MTGTQAGEGQVSSQIGQYIQYGRYENSYGEKTGQSKKKGLPEVGGFELR